MKKIPRISESEWEVMKVLWSRAPLSAGEVIDALSAQADWHPKTVKTLLNRLTNKRALTFTKQGRAYLYRPTVSEEQCLHAASESFLQRFFGGSVQPLLAHFVQHRRLTQAEINELKKLLE